MGRQAWLQAVMLAGLLLRLQAGGDETQAALRFSRQALEQGAWWRLFTAHFIHLGWAHTVLNIAGVLLCCALAPQLFNPYIWPRMACLAFGVGISLWRSEEHTSELPSLIRISCAVFCLIKKI